MPTLAFDITSEACLYHDPNRYGFFSILTDQDGQRRQRSYRLPLLAEVLECLPRDKNSWISQFEFVAPNRRVVNLARITMVFVDIDCYKLGLSPKQAWSGIQFELDDRGWPPPSVAIHSGRGLQLKWLHDPVPRHALPRWNSVQRHLVAALLPWGADPAAKDASRVLRLVDTLNTKSGEVVRVMYATRTANGKVQRYDFDQLSEYFLPHSRAELVALRAANSERYAKENQRRNHPFTEDQKAARVRRRESGLRVIGGNPKARSRFSARTLAWGRLEDLRMLYKLRNGETDGWSMPLLFWSMNFLLLSGATNSSEMYREAQAVAREYGWKDFSRGDELSSLYSRAKKYESGKVVTHNGRTYPSLYTPTNETLINLFQIESDEQKVLRTIIGRDEARARDSKRHLDARRKAGVVSREEYLMANSQKRSEARLRRSKGESIRAIAEAMNVSFSTISEWVKK